jgi:hypothetical protein
MLYLHAVGHLRRLLGFSDHVVLKFTIRFMAWKSWSWQTTRNFQNWKGSLGWLISPLNSFGTEKLGGAGAWPRSSFWQRLLWEPTPAQMTGEVCGFGIYIVFSLNVHLWYRISDEQFTCIVMKSFQQPRL